MSNLSTLSFKQVAKFATTLFLAVSAISFLLQFFSKEMSSGRYLSYQQYSNKMADYYAVRESVEAVTLGPSHSKAVHFQSLAVKGVSFYESFGDIEEAHFKFQRLIQETPKLRYVFIPLSPGSLALNNSNSSLDNNRLRNVLRNTPLLKLDYIRYANELFLNQLDYYMPIFDYQVLIRSNISKYIRGGNNEFNDKDCFYNYSPNPKWLIENGIVGGYNRNLMKPECISKYAKSTIKNHVNAFSKSLSKEYDVIEKNTQRLIEIADSLKKRGGSLVLFIPPITREYYSSTEIQSFLPEHLSILTNLAEHSAIQFYDYHDFFYKDLDTGVNDYFSDDDHLALPGAIKFSLAFKVKLDEHRY
ncbi:hypothetical protein [Photobacterium kasasachensis]|uniref:hypothetical protein n=1 Tax=Photobacterium kasasachensis TaxID=2910240 RepID=UPI003D099BDF